MHNKISITGNRNVTLALKCMANKCSEPYKFMIHTPTLSAKEMCRGHFRLVSRISNII